MAAFKLQTNGLFSIRVLKTSKTYQGGTNNFSKCCENVSRANFRYCGDIVLVNLVLSQNNYLSHRALPLYSKIKRKIKNPNLYQTHKIIFCKAVKARLSHGPFPLNSRTEIINVNQQPPATAAVSIHLSCCLYNLRLC